MSSAADGGVLVVHTDPADRGRSDRTARADLAPFGLEGQVEQLWLRDLGDGTYALACIPFCVCGLALGDVVALAPDGRVGSLVRAEGGRALRVLLLEQADPARPGDAAAEIKAAIAAAGLRSEWHGDRLVALDVPPDAQLAQVAETVARHSEAGRVMWEWADSMPFAAA
jgi:hypothetical protein